MADRRSLLTDEELALRRKRNKARRANQKAPKRPCILCANAFTREGLCNRCSRVKPSAKFSYKLLVSGWDEFCARIEKKKQQGDGKFSQSKQSRNETKLMCEANFAAPTVLEVSSPSTLKGSYSVDLLGQLERRVLEWKEFLKAKS
jgi:hypothetical protein